MIDELLMQVASTQELFDRGIRLWTDNYTKSGGTIFCGQGCRGCCNLAVNCTFPEAVAIARGMTDEQAERVARRVALLRKHLGSVTDMKSFLRLHRKELGFCPFLDIDGSCGTYDIRPISCRSLLATKESRWCSADFSELAQEEKREFVESLDRHVVAFPMHYVAAMQNLGGELEQMTAQQMEERFGFSLYGNLPLLVWLEREHRLSEHVATGFGAVAKLLQTQDALHPFLVILNRDE